MYIFSIFNNFFVELTPHIKSYLTSGNIEENIPLLQRMCTYFVFYDIPYKMDYQTICKFTCLLIYFYADLYLL